VPTLPARKIRKPDLEFAPGSFRRLVLSLVVAASHLVLAGPFDPVANAQTIAVTGTERSFIGPDGNPLPFRNDEETMEFLRTARVVSESTIGTGINRSQKMLLEKDEIRSNSIYRETDTTESDAYVGGRMYRVFHDSYRFECAAYELAKLLRIFNIPPVVLRSIGRREGSLQIWVEDVLDEDKAGFKPPDIGAWVHQLRDMIFFDNFIYNVDRNGGNILVTSDYTLVMIDHTRGFQENIDIMNPDRLTQVNRVTWGAFQSLTEEQIRNTVRPYLTPAEMTALVRRHQVMLDYFAELIGTRGEGTVVLP
jgi:hypothetical protein